MTTIDMNGVSATLKFHEFDDFYRWELVLASGKNYARIDGILDDSKHSLKFNGEEATLEIHKTDKVHWKLVFGSEVYALEEGYLTETSEFDLFIKIAKDMGVKIAILCPHQCFKDYLSFKPDIPNRTERISTYLAADWHEDSELGQQISQMKSVCKTYFIEFELELMRDFFEGTYVSMDSFIKTLVTKSDNEHRAFIMKLIADFESTTVRKQKEEICKRIYDYLLHNALNYVNKTQKFKDTVIKKAYELKSEGIPELIQSIDNFLTAIGEPLVPSVIPIVEDCPYCDKDCNEDCDEDSDDGYLDTWTQYIEDPYLCDKYYRKGGPCDQEKARSKLIQDIFKKEELTFTRKVMPLYYEWEKTAPKLNRYKKVCLFIEDLEWLK